MTALRGAPPSLDLSPRPRPPTQTYRGDVVERTVRREQRSKVESTALRLGATEFMVLFAAYAALLSRYSGQRDLVVGTPIANRTRSELEGLIGFFVNTLALRFDVDPKATFADLVRLVRTRTLEAHAHQDLPFEKLVASLALPRDRSRSPVFQVMFSLQNTPEASLDIPGVRLREMGTTSGVAKFDLTLTVVPRGPEYDLVWELNSDLFERDFIERMADHFERLLEGALDGDGPVALLPLLSVAEQREQLVAWNDTAKPYPREHCIHTLFEEQARKTPDAIALVARDASLSYRELDERANALAFRLRERGVGPETIVGVFLERTSQLVVTLLGVLKAGAAYAPLDPAYPVDRIAFILEDTDAPVVVTSAALLDRLPSAIRDRCVIPDTGEKRTSAPAIGGLSAKNRAYVIFTSGSTGRPKGVDIEHGSAVAFVHWSLDFFSREQLAVVLAATSVCFDLSIFEIFVTLAAGGTIVLAENALDLAALPARDRVTLVNTVPSAIAELLKMGAIPDSVRTVNLAGEALPAETVALLYARPSIDAVYNLYGPSEDTTYSTWELTTRGGWAPNVGRPIANGAAFVLDADLQPVPVGVRGEIYVAGAGLARGYLRRPDLTADRFVPNPFSAVPGERLYRTGDVGRFLPTGQIEYLGRVDHQVKIRGFRIELGEVEAALASHDTVAESIVLARGASGEQRLVAYVTARPKAVVDVDALREHLKARLPAYMVPSAFVVLDAMPLNANGKTDRKQLPEPDAARTHGDHEAPRDDAERSIAGIWSNILGVEGVGRTDDFFALGGHSLLAMRVISRIRTELGREVPLLHVFEAPVLADFAARVERAALAGGLPLARSARPDGRAPLSFAQERLWFLEQLEPGGVAYNMPAALRVEGELDAETLERAISVVVQRHEALRTTFDGETQRIHPSMAIPVERVALRGLPASAVEPRIRAEIESTARRPFDLSRGPLLRVRLLDLGPGDQILLITMHHIVSDGWSIGVLLRDVAAAYAHQEHLLPELPVQYPDFATWQRAWLTGDELERQLAYWTTHLRDAPPSLDLPTKPRPPTQTYLGKTLRTALSQGIRTRIEAVARATATTDFMVLLAAYGAILSRYSGQNDLVIGTPVANRTRSELDGLIGFFVNTLPLRLDAHGTFADLLARVKDTTLGAQSHQDLPFEKLVAALAPPRDLSRTPIFQVMFALLNTPAPSLDIQGVRLRELDTDDAVAKFDLTLEVVPAASGFVLAWEFNSDLFEVPFIRQLASHFERFLDRVLGDLSVPVARVPILDEAERRWLLAECNATARPTPREPLHALFAAAARRGPERTAVVLANERLTYRELDQRAKSFARRLRELGKGAGDFIPLALDRSVELLVAILATLEIGAAYVPVDPRQSSERLAQILTDTRADIVVTSDTFSGPLGPELAMDARLEAPAYVIFTSGSTGIPKGVVVSHRSAVNYVSDFVARLAISAEDRLLQFASPLFDVSVEEIFGTLLAGATLVVRPPEPVSSVASIFELCTTEAVTILDVPTAFWVEIVAALDGGLRLPPTIRAVVIGGEAARADTVATWRRHVAPHVRLLNSYGPTEATIGPTVAALDALGPDDEVPIGRPISNVLAYVVDDEDELVPVGVVGELLLGGDGVALGYLARPELTAERFVPDPFGPGTVYRTGDRVRRRADGQLVYVGRTDQQVKVRGFRVEIGEIEHVVIEHGDVRDAAVLAVAHGGSHVLVAYLTATHDAIDLASLRALARARLPAYMVPSAFVPLDAMPLTPSGKIDRKRLPPWRPESEAYAAPRSALEQGIATILADVLKADRVGLDDDFFTLGGHSLLVIRALARLREALGVEISVASFLGAPTVRALAAALVAQPRSTTKASDVVTIREGSDDLVIVLVHALGGSSLLYAPLALGLAGTRKIVGLNAPGLENGSAPLTSMSALADFHVRALRDVLPRKRIRLVGWSMGGILAIEIARRLDLGDALAVERVIAIDSFAADAVPRTTEREDLVSFVLDLFATYRIAPDMEKADLARSAPREAVLDALAEALVAGGALRAEGARAEVERMAAVYRASSDAFSTHVLARWAGPVTLVTAGERAGIDQLEDCEIVRVDGVDHHTILASEAVARVVEQTPR